MPASPAQLARNRLATLISNYAPEDQILAARQALAEALITQRVAEVVAKSPPLTRDQRDRLGRIFTAPGPLTADRIRAAS